MRSTWPQACALSKYHLPRPPRIYPNYPHVFKNLLDFIIYNGYRYCFPYDALSSYASYCLGSLRTYESNKTHQLGFYHSSHLGGCKGKGKVKEHLTLYLAPFKSKQVNPYVQVRRVSSQNVQSPKLKAQFDFEAQTHELVHLVTRYTTPDQRRTSKFITRKTGFARLHLCHSEVRNTNRKST